MVREREKYFLGGRPRHQSPVVAAPRARRSFSGLNLKGALGCSVSQEPLLGGRAMGSSIAGGATGYPSGCWERGESPAILRRCSITELGCGVPPGPCGRSLGESHRSHFRPAALRAVGLRGKSTCVGRGGRTRLGDEGCRVRTRGGIRKAKGRTRTGAMTS